MSFVIVLQIEDKEGLLVYPVLLINIREKPYFATVYQYREASLYSRKVAKKLAVLGVAQRHADGLYFHQNSRLSSYFEGEVYLLAFFYTYVRNELRYYFVKAENVKTQGSQKR